MSDEPKIAALKAIAEGFNDHDIDKIMSYFVDDCVFDAPRGDAPAGRHFEGRAAVADGLSSRFRDIPDVHYGEDRHWVAGNRGVSEWLLTGTTTDGRRVEVRGCDLWEFRGDKVTRKDSYWKIVG